MAHATPPEVRWDRTRGGGTHPPAPAARRVARLHLQRGGRRAGPFRQHV